MGGYLVESYLFALEAPSLLLGACPANPHLPFDKLRVNGMGIENIDVFPFC
jgi:hypothetical protein